MLAHDATTPPLPRGLIVELPDAGEAILLLRNSLAWVRDLANSYVGSFQTTLLKSKGLLYPTLYVSMYADAEKLKSAEQQPDNASRGVKVKKQRHAKRQTIPEHAPAQIANICTSHHWALSDLKAKLKSFEEDYPALHKKMETKMAALHRAATE